MCKTILSRGAGKSCDSHHAVRSCVEKVTVYHVVESDIDRLGVVNIDVTDKILFWWWTNLDAAPLYKSQGTWRVKQKSTLDFIPFKMIGH